MEIKYRDIILRDPRSSDIDDEIRWHTTETEWAKWDAPWETESEIAEFDAESYREKQLKALETPFEGLRWSFEIDTSDGVHIGTANSYLIDENYEWIAYDSVRSGQKVYRAVGLDIMESAYWNSGLGTQVLAAFIRYFMQNGCDEIYTQTWSGNVRMVKCAEKLGFSVCKTKSGVREVRGKTYDALTFRLDIDRFLKNFD